MKKRIALSLLAIGCGVCLRFAKRKPRICRFETPAAPALFAEPKRDIVLQRYMMYFMLPLWFVPGVLDYAWHRRTNIETTSGIEESAIHALMMTEVGIPIVAGLLLEIDAGVLLLMMAAFFLHSLTAVWDVAFAVKRRTVMPNEQHTHSFLEILPFCAVSFAVCLHWEQFAALFGQGPERARFEIRWKNPPLPRRYVGGILGAIGVFVVLPYAEELLRCRRAQQQGLVGTQTSECSQELFASANVLGIPT